MRYTEEEMRERRLAKEAERAEKEAKKAAREQKKADKEARRQAREEKRNAAKKLIAEYNEKHDKNKPEFTLAQYSEIRKTIRKELEEKVFRPMHQVETVDISADGKIYRKFTCDELIKIFGGWFSLRYLFSVQSETEKSPLTGKPIETDFYVCSRDVSGMNVNERPPLNEALHKQFGVDVYGFCIIAPSTVF